MLIKLAVDQNRDWETSHMDKLRRREVFFTGSLHRLRKDLPSSCLAALLSIHLRVIPQGRIHVA